MTAPRRANFSLYGAPPGACPLDHVPTPAADLFDDYDDDDDDSDDRAHACTDTDIDYTSTDIDDQATDQDEPDDPDDPDDRRYSSPSPDSTYEDSHHAFVSAFDWASTELGCQDRWSPTLSTYYTMVMASPFPALLVYGPQLSLVYNAEFGNIIGLNDKLYFGRDFAEVWTGSDLSIELSNAVTQCMTTRTTVTRTALLCFVMSPCSKTDSGYRLKETYFTWKLSPVIELRGNVSGAFVSVQDTTDAVLYDRRMLVLRELYDATGRAELLSDFYAQSVAVLRKHSAEDIALFGLYIQDAAKTLHYRCGFGLKDFPTVVDFDPNHELFEQAIYDSSLSAVYITAKAAAFRSYIEFDPTRGWSDPIIDLVFLPVMRDNNCVVGVAIIGLNPRRSFDEPYETFLELLGRQLAACVDNLRHIEETNDKLVGELASFVQRREELEILLLERTRQLQISEDRFSRMAKILPAGLFLATADGKIIYANAAWYRMSSYPLDGNPSYWIKSVHPGDHTLVRESFRRAMQGKEERIEFRWARRAGEAPNIERWCASAISAESDPQTNQIMYLTGVWTDITERKQSEALQRQRADEAVERRRQQEYFIDAISHEMRNPLSAITQSIEVISDKISSAATGLRDVVAENTPPTPQDMRCCLDDLQESQDTLDTIQLCASHMSLIISDTINLSKAESGLFPVNPVPCRPLDVVKQVVRMYEHELRSISAAHSIELGTSYRLIGVDTVKMDPHRVSQVLINLLSNAMKAVSTVDDARSISIKIDASTAKPTLQLHNHSSFYVQPSKSSGQLRNSYSGRTASSVSTSPTRSHGLARRASSISLLSTPAPGPAAASSSFSSGNSTTSNLFPVKSYAKLAAGISASPSTLMVNTELTHEGLDYVYIIFSVKDNGKGMDPQQLRTAFQRFTSHFTPRTHVNYGGSGLGLYVSRKLVENQGGELTGESKVNEGSEFVFYIKAARTSASAVDAAQELSIMLADGAVQMPPRSPRSGPISTPPPLSRSTTPRVDKKLTAKLPNPYAGRRILIVEDNIVNQGLLQRQFQNAGFTTVVANHGQEALDIVYSGQELDCCLMDCEMPVMDGVKAVEKIREKERLAAATSGEPVLRRLPIIALSANSRKEHFDKMYKAGSDLYITKPFKFPLLVEAVNGLLAQQDQRECEQPQQQSPQLTISTTAAPLGSSSSSSSLNADATTAPNPDNDEKSEPS
ncbi:uncharacterized protein V1518DRAFT_383134 [Limtongia smithiae]|uniref:uncharacterized protein n=1 Tax=Limtongia smithiae TaxID=1125753 RepID=UPI0034CD96B4